MKSMVTGLITTVVHHTGEVFLNDKSLYEKETLEKVYHPEALPNAQDPEGSTYTWYCEHNEQKQPFGQTSIKQIRIRNLSKSV